MNRLLMAPALVCIVVGAALGGWGWGQRDEARAQVVLEADASRDRIEGGVDMSLDDFGRIRTTCQALWSAVALDPPAAGPGMAVPGGAGDPDGPVPTDPAADEASLRALVAVLDPASVEGLPGLDEPNVRDAMASLREALIRALEHGGPPDDDGDVVAAARELGAVLETTPC